MTGPQRLLPRWMDTALLRWSESKPSKGSEKLQSDWQLGRGQFELASFGVSRREAAGELLAAQDAGLSRVMRKM